MQLKQNYVLILACALMLAGCTSRQTAEQRRADADTPAGKLGQAAHKAAVEADKAGKVAARKLQQAAHDAKAGWQEDAQKNKATR